MTNTDPKIRHPRVWAAHKSAVAIAEYRRQLEDLEHQMAAQMNLLTPAEREALEARLAADDRL